MGCSFTGFTGVCLLVSFSSHHCQWYKCSYSCCVSPLALPRVCMHSSLLYSFMFIECHTSVSSLPFCLRSGLHHLTEFLYFLKIPSLFHLLTYLCKTTVFCSIMSLSETLQVLINACRLACRSPSLWSKEVPVTQSTLFPQINYPALVHKCYVAVP